MGNNCEESIRLDCQGILKYNLPMSKVTKSVVVSKVGYIDPNQDSL